MKLLKYIANEVFSSKMLYEILQLQNEDAQCRRKSENLCQLLSSKKEEKKKKRIHGVSMNTSFLSLRVKRYLTFPLTNQELFFRYHIKKRNWGARDQDFFHSVTA